MPDFGSQTALHLEHFPDGKKYPFMCPPFGQKISGCWGDQLLEVQNRLFKINIGVGCLEIEEQESETSG